MWLVATVAASGQACARQEASRVARLPAAAATLRIQTALPTESDPFVAPPGSDPGQGWAVLAEAGQLRSMDEIDAVTDILQQPDTAPRRVLEMFHDQVGSRVALATCKGHQAVIYYSAPDLAKFDERTVAFLKQHELAHHRLGQVDCTGAQPRFPRRDEKKADCAAVDVLRTAGLKGRDIVMSISSVFHFIDKPEDPPYPATRTRAAYLSAGCGVPLPSS